MEAFIGLVMLGLALGACGTLIGAGGGFVLMPLLLLIYTHESAERLAAISLIVVFFNAASGSVAYARMKRIDYRAGLLFSAAGIPGAIAGAFSTGLIPKAVFDGVLGVLMVGSASYLFFSRQPSQKEAESGGIRGPSLAPRYNRKLGIGISLLVGYLSSLLGIGGGIMHVPIMARVLRFPVHVATATSHFILAILALTGSVVHVFGGHLDGGLDRIAPLSLGVVLGAQFGAFISDYVHGKWIIRGLALALAFVGIRILMIAFS
jgi:hypothetical protein